MLVMQSERVPKRSGQLVWCGALSFLLSAHGLAKLSSYDRWNECNETHSNAALGEGANMQSKVQEPERRAGEKEDILGRW